jgi:hypothetical protein
MILYVSYDDLMNISKWDFLHVFETKYSQNLDSCDEKWGFHQFWIDYDPLPTRKYYAKKERLRPDQKYDDYTQNSSENPFKIKSQAQINNRAQHFKPHSEIWDLDLYLDLDFSRDFFIF